MPSEASKLLERMRRSKEGWTRKDLDILYESFGFVIRHGASHDVASHPDYPQLRETLPRHRKVPSYLVRNAVKLMDRLIELQKAEQDNSSEDEENE